MSDTSVNKKLFLKLFLKVLLKTENTVWKLRMIIKISSALLFDLEIFTHVAHIYKNLATDWFGLKNWETRQLRQDKTFKDSKTIDFRI